MNKTSIVVFLILSYFFTSSGQNFKPLPYNSKPEKVDAVFNNTEPDGAKYLKNAHDLNLPDWGPYSDKYAGISHIPDVKKGVRFDVCVFPGFYKRKVVIPNVEWETEFHPWESSPDLSYYSFRMDMEWKDQVYTEVSFSEIDSNARLIRAECVNNTDMPQIVVLHYVAYLNFPDERIYSTEPLRAFDVNLPDKALWIEALDYKEMKYAVGRPTDNLMPDGYFRGEIHANGFVNGNALGRDNFGRDNGDLVKYPVNLKENINNAVLLFRYRMKKDETVTFQLNGLANTQVIFKGTGDFATQVVSIGNVKAGEQLLTMKSLGGAAIELDGFAIAPDDVAGQITFSPAELNHYPEILQGTKPNSTILKYKQADDYYGITWAFNDYELRQIFGDDLNFLFRKSAHWRFTVHKEGYESSEHYTDVFLRPVVLQPHSKRVVYGMVCNGTKNQVSNYISAFDETQSSCDKIYDKAKKNLIDLSPTPAGQKYLLSQQLISAVTLSSLTYPVYTKGTYIRHYTPGRSWSCLYTWDSGFTGLGLLQLDADRAIDHLNVYVTEPGDEHAAFMHHGTPLPTHIYLFLKIWNQTQSRKVLEYFYPRLRQYYKFIAGTLGSSTTRTLKSNILKTWDYFYNSGGWDDYPPQVYVHDKALEKTVAPVVSTAHAIRVAKILRMAASELALEADIKEYQADIDVFSKALQKYSWDEESGYFGYVQHDEQGNPVGILKHESGKNFNMGFDGAYPLVSGICNKKQEEAIMKHLTTEGELWSWIGLSAVDQSSPYYLKDGYWNGAVWMPHQWFFWNTMLDLGYGDFAYKIAHTALDLWKKEADYTYNCPEHFNIETGRGAGWQQFSGLSCPVMIWFATYYRPGTLTTGFNVWIKEKYFSDNNTALSSVLKLYDVQPDRHINIIVCMNPGYKYNITWNGEKPIYKELSAGTYQIDIPGSVTDGHLLIGKSVN